MLLVEEEGRLEIYKSLSQNFRNTDNNNLLGRNNHSLEHDLGEMYEDIRALAIILDTRD